MSNYTFTCFKKKIPVFWERSGRIVHLLKKVGQKLPLCSTKSVQPSNDLDVKKQNASKDKHLNELRPIWTSKWRIQPVQFAALYEL